LYNLKQGTSLRLLVTFSHSSTQT